MLVKVCGVCRPRDAEAAAKAGADCLGVILSPGFRRSRELAEAGAIYEAGAGVRRVGVFVDADRATIDRAAEELSLGTVQLHGAEPPDLAAALLEAGFVVWKAIRPRSGEDLLEAAARYRGVVDALLVDGAAPGSAGGAGARFDWASVAGVRRRLPRGLAFLAAGGLTPANVGEAVRLLHPDGVDVSSGVESAPGEKSSEAIRAFVAAARTAAADIAAHEKEPLP